MTQLAGHTKKMHVLIGAAAPISTCIFFVWGEAPLVIAQANVLMLVRFHGQLWLRWRAPRPGDGYS
jgi:hypothetical protein